ncbi:MAG: type III pantothenate kinase [Clostridia bacterium]|nr:type III pantothenate kinase [Clostridia bacterium]
MEIIMLLTTDIGNTYISIGAFKDDKLIFVSEILTDINKSCDQYAIELIQIADLYNIKRSEVDGAIMCSVVPELSETIKGALKKVFCTEALIVGPGVKTGLKIGIDNPAQLGADIVADAVAAMSKYPAPCIICDFGTATVFSVIDEQKSYRGAIISAGVGTTLDALTKKTALLPHVSIQKPDNIVGTNTIESVQSGLINGTAAMVDGIISRLKGIYGNDTSVIATGKYANKIIPSCMYTDIIIEEYLIFEGLREIYKRNMK